MNPNQTEAIANCLQQIAKNPQVAEYHADLGDLYVREEKWQKAIGCYNRAIEIDPEFARGHYSSAEVWTRLGKKQHAAERLNSAYKLKPDMATSQQHYELARTFQSLNKPEKAIVSCRRAIARQADFFLAYRDLGQLLIQQGKYKQALAAYRQGIQHYPQQPQLHLGLGQALAADRQWNLAFKSYQKALELDPNLAEVYYYWGLLLAEQKKFIEAEKCYQKAIALRENYVGAYYQLGLLWEQQGKQDKAFAAYHKANAVRPRNSDKLEDAIAAYKKAVALSPQNSNKLDDMGKIYRRFQKYELAISYYREKIDNSSDISNEIEAVEEYRETLTEYPQVTARHYCQFAKLLRAKGLFPRAVAMYQKALALNPRFRLAYIDLQYTNVAKQQLPGLIEFYRQIVTQHPDIAIAWGNLGDALTQQNSISEAIECYRQSSYTQTVKMYPYLAKLDWKEQKELGPDFIIAGASKSGTTSVYHYLRHHPQVLLSHKKEINFYSQDYQRGLDWYLAHFPTITDNPDFLTGEATPNYIRFPQAARRIKDTFPKTKIIVLLRNPADRAISWHYHKYNSGLTNLDLKTAIATEIKKLAAISEAEIDTGYCKTDNIVSSLYIYQVKPWIEILGREQFLILKSEDFYANPEENMAKVCQFLGLPNCPLDKYPRVNSGSYNEIDSSLRQTLVEYFAPYNLQLEEYLGMQFNWQ